MIRLHVTQPLASGAEIVPEATQAHYLLNVMRLKPGAELLLFNGCDGEWRAVLTQADKRRCRLQAASQTRPQAAPPDLELAVALVKRARLETIVEKAAELGCRRVRLALTRRTNADHAKIERLRAIATEASEQTGRLDVPEVCEPTKLERLLDEWPEDRRLMFCDEAGDDPDQQWGGADGRARPVTESLLPRETGEGDHAQRGGRGSRRPAPSHAPSTASRSPSPVPRELHGGGATGWTILIGPEGGFDPAERERLRALPFVTPVTLGPRILRADTAAIAALTLWQATLGDWR